MFMGYPLNHQRTTWAVAFGGPDQASQNDVGIMASITQNPGMTLLNSGNGHTFATATPLALIGNAVNVALAKGVISPASAANPIALGVNNYTKDDFSFYSDGVHPITLTAHDGTDLLTAGVADFGITLRSSLSIYNASAALVGTATEDASTLFETYTGLLPAGFYLRRDQSFGGHVETSNPILDPKQMYDMGAYFLTGSGFVSPAGQIDNLVTLVRSYHLPKGTENGFVVKLNARAPP